MSATQDELVKLASDGRSFAEGLRVQANASAMKNAMAGHPNPEYFFGRASQIMDDLVKYLEEKANLNPPKEPGDNLTSDALKPPPETPAQPPAPAETSQKVKK